MQFCANSAIFTSSTSLIIYNDHFKHDSDSLPSDESSLFGCIYVSTRYQAGAVIFKANRLKYD